MVVVTHLFEPERASLVALLKSLSVEQWQAPTVCPGWSVEDVALHLLGDDIGLLSRRRDGLHQSDAPREFGGWRDLVAFLDHLNQTWVEATRRISPRLLAELLLFTGEATWRYLASLDPFALEGQVSRVGPDPVPNWLDVAREYTERWTHQQQIRDAVRTLLRSSPEEVAARHHPPKERDDLVGPGRILEREAADRQIRWSPTDADAATSGRGGVGGQDEPPAEDVAAIREAVLGFYQDSVTLWFGPQRDQVPRVPRVPRRRRLQWAEAPAAAPARAADPAWCAWSSPVGRGRPSCTSSRRSTCTASSAARTRGSRKPRYGASPTSSGRSTSGSDPIETGPGGGARLTGPSWRPRSAPCWPTTWVAAKPTTRYWARSRRLGRYEARRQEQQERLLLQVERDRHAVRAEFIRQERVELGRQQRAMDRYLAGWRR
jgi:uncharacterized protein (TIGR03083 family)